MTQNATNPTEELSDEEWLTTLSAADRERFDNTVRAVESSMPGADAFWMVRADRAERHAPLALHMLMDFVRHSGSWRSEDETIQDAYHRDWKSLGPEYAGEVKAAVDAVGRMVAAGVSESDLRAFARMIEAAKIDNVFWTICQGGLDQDIPGWRLMEVGIDGKLTGRPLSLWGVYATEPVSGLEDKSDGGPDADEPRPF